jgi:hypothetical protein
MCCATQRIIVNVELVKTIVHYYLSFTLKASTTTVSCFGSEAKRTKENKTKDASWGIPVLKELILCTEQ